MRTPSSTSRRLAPVILTTATLSLFALHCGSDDGGLPMGGAGTSTQPTSGSGGTASQGGSSAGMTTGGMVTSAGTANGGSGTAGTGTAGTGSAGTGTAGTAGASGSASGGTGSSGGGTGGSGSGGGSAGTGSGGGSGVTFTQVKDLLAMSCKGSKCHDAGNAGKQVDLTTSDGLYTRLTTPLPDTTAHCGGDTAIVPGMPTASLLVKAVTGPGKVTCKKGGGTEMIARMPDDCPTDRACLTDAQIKLISDWVTAGAKQ
jgi:hypothetical protein